VPVPLGRIIMQPLARVAVDVREQRFMTIRITNLPDSFTDDPKLRLNDLIAEILDKQKLNVDVVGGASYTKKAVRKAIENAFSDYLASE
jgi:uncharacterized protein with FMN-binding domain